MRPTVAVIDLDALMYNYNQVKGIVGKDVAVAPVVKADAYGHGAVNAAARLERAGADRFIVAFIEEGLELRDAGIKAPILLIGPIFPDDSDYIIRRDLTPVVFNMEQIDALDRSAKESGRCVKVHIKVDTGMGRLGIPPEDLAGFVKDISVRRNIIIEGIMTHFAEVDAGDMEFAIRQLKVFKEALEELRIKRIKGINKIDPPIVHAANSSAIICFNESHFNMVRPGLMLYGSYPAGNTKNIYLRPVMSLVSKVAQVRQIPKGRSIGYGKSFITKRDSLIATIPIGYADGYSRRLSNRGHVIIRGKTFPIIGNVCMDMTMVDVTDHHGVCVGDEAVLIGKQGDQAIRAEDLAEVVGTIPYEILSCIGKRVPRVYIG